METKKYEAIAHDAVIAIKLNGAFYGRLHHLYLYLAHQKTVEEFAEILNYLKSNERARDEYEDALLTVMTLITEVDKRAREQGVTQMYDIPAEK